MLNRRRFLQSTAVVCLVAASGVEAQALPASDGFTFLVVGDWGQLNDPQRAVAAAMGDEAARKGARFIISTGDNFYSEGVSSFDDPLWRTVFEDIYTAPSLQVPLYPVLGNHDRRGNAMAQVAYSGRSDRWRMPGPFYRQRETIAGGDHADFFFLDTEWIYAETSRISPALDGDDDDDQIQWLEQELAASQARWKIVIGHHPVYSGGNHGSTPGLKRAVLPILERYGAHAYLQGHDHCLQHVAVNGIHYLTSGTGAESKAVSPIDGTRFAADSLGFLTAKISVDAIDIRIVDADGQELYAARLPHPESAS
jgi:tartrate-resistant acid phosphatase type 5